MTNGPFGAIRFLSLSRRIFSTWKGKISPRRPLCALQKGRAYANCQNGKSLKLHTGQD